MIFFNELLNHISSETTEKYIIDEVDRLELSLYDKSEENKQLIIENITSDLLHGYYQAREKVNPHSSIDENRKNMNCFYEALSLVIFYLGEKLKFSYSEKYIESWEKRCKGNYFPFGDAMRYTSQKNDTKEPPILSEKQFATLLSNYINDITYSNLLYFMQNKELPKDINMARWKGSAADAVSFADYFKIKISEWNKAFYLKRRDGTNRKLKFNDRSDSHNPEDSNVMSALLGK